MPISVSPLGTYSHVLPTMGKDAAAKIDDLLKPQS